MYQWNPAAAVHGDIHWGHMSSADLLSWRDDGVALRPRPGDIDAAGVWSGVAVPDAGGVALVYTAVPDDARHACVAVARQAADGTWAQPGRVATQHPDHRRWRDVRDPFVLSVDGRRLGIMGAGRAGAGQSPPRGGAVLVYDADDLDDWTLLGALLVADELPAGMVGAGAIWECPQLVPVREGWLLVVSWDDGAAAQPAGSDGISRPRHGVACYSGELDVTGPVPRFTPATEALLDHGPDFYAPQLVIDGDRVLAWGWSWEGRGAGTNHRSDAEVAACGWAGTLTFPREVVLGPAGAGMCVPARELEALEGRPLPVHSTGDGVEMQTDEAAWVARSAGGVLVELVDGSTGQVRPVWSSRTEGPITVFADGSIVEVFAEWGTSTRRAYPAAGEVWRVRSGGPMVATVLRVPVGR